MAYFYRYETVDIPLKFTPTGVLNGYKHIVVSINQDEMVKIDKDDNDLDINVEEDIITISLSQEETSQFSSGSDNNPRKAKIQVNIYYNNSERDVSTIGFIDVYDNLYKQVMTND